jgi:two-component system chemotaxis response regulator CheY
MATAATASFVKTHPDVVLCDVHMAPIDGEGFLRLVRDSEIAWVRDVPVIFLSGDNLVDTVRGAMRRHADGYLVKPFRLSDLRKQLDITLTLLAEHAHPTRT